MREHSSTQTWGLRLAGAALALAIPAVALAQPFGHGDGFRRGPMMQRRGVGGGLPIHALDLTAQQREQIHGIMQSHREQFRAIAERHRAARAALDAAAEAPTVDETLIRQRSTELAAVQADGAILRAQVRSQVHALLTPEQQEKAAALRQQREQRMDQRRQQMKERLELRQRQRQPQ